ncbi:MAG: aminoacyl-tRNA hydrolase [Patescibacteria group bacterium]|nr:aminoacyl-tRNA hydrolase [Patescibacteria group bacterium]
MKKGPQIIIGLGNPGAEFENTYHNAGVLAVEHLAQKLENGEWRMENGWKTHKKLFDYSSPLPARLPTLILIRPLTFMNESGLAAKEALKKFRAAPENLTIIHDDSDLALGEFKITRGQNSAGHKGVQSVIDHLGTKEFGRIKIGIREQETKNGERRQKAEEFVLKQIKPKDRKILEDVFGKIAAILSTQA